jgi:acetylornithine/succinyldiaminopimelate/putrescine aminotransferase
VLTDSFLAEIAANGDAFMGRLRAIDDGRVLEVRGRGLMIAVELDGDRDRVLRELQNEGVLALPAGASAVRFLPPYVVQRSDLERAAGVLADVLGRG